MRATAALFASGAALTLVDAVLTRRLLHDPGRHEQWVPVRMLVAALGIDVALALCSLLAIGAMAAVAWGAVRVRPPRANLAFLVLCVAVGARAFGCVNNFGMLLA